MSYQLPAFLGAVPYVGLIHSIATSRRLSSGTDLSRRACKLAAGGTHSEFLPDSVWKLVAGVSCLPTVELAPHGRWSLVDCDQSAVAPLPHVTG